VDSAPEHKTTRNKTNRGSGPKKLHVEFREPGREQP
jgi:hypothetical protein